jgi:poly(3-hydroxybutyrate) depolymerase
MQEVFGLMRQIDRKSFRPTRREERAAPHTVKAACCLEDRQEEFDVEECRVSRLAALIGIILAASALSGGPALAAGALPKLGADLAQTSVSGLSSGAYMAGQIQVAHSKDIVGAGIVAGGPFACAETDASMLFPFWPTAVAQNAARALYACMKTTVGEPDPARSAKRAKDLADAGAIDPLSGLAADNVYLFSGNEDQTVTRPVVKAAEQFYKEAGVDPGNLTLVEAEGGHAFLTEEGGAACGITDKPYVSDCDYDQAKAILSWIYGPLAEASPGPQGNFVVFDQQPFAEPGDGLADEGMVYVPPACEPAAAGCRVHIALHGCAQSRETVGDVFVKQAGFAEIADQNRLIVLFPQTKAGIYNPEGCWDWWGYTGLDYLGKDASQIKAIWAMVEQLAAQP